MSDCSQLQALLSQDQQTRRAMDHPNKFCQDDCDSGDINCIKACLRSLDTRKQALDDAIAHLNNEIFICGILLKTWKYSGSGWTGLLTIQSLSGQITETSFGFTGRLVLDADPTDTNGIEGIWNEQTQRLTFTRTLAPTRHQQYLGFISTYPSSDRTLAGTFTDDAYPAGTEFGWFALPQ